MNTDTLTNPTVKAAIEVLQSGDKNSWAARFEAKAQLYDDGKICNLKDVAETALGHERFTPIDNVENNGLDLIGSFHSDQWAISMPISDFDFHHRARFIGWRSGRQLRQKGASD